MKGMPETSMKKMQRSRAVLICAVVLCLSLFGMFLTRGARTIDDRNDGLSEWKRWSPTCRFLPDGVEWEGKSLTAPPGTMCLTAGRPHDGVFPCGRAKGYKPKPLESGAWTLDEHYAYLIDLGLARELSSVFANGSVIELGAGKGCYSSHLAGSGRGIRSRAFDGVPNIAAVTRGSVQRQDLTARAEWARQTWVLCLEVAEHIPAEHEAALLDNIHRHNTRGVILSWAVPGQGGQGHVNERSGDYVIRRMESLGYRHDAEGTRKLRAASKLFWFRSSLHKFDRLD